MEGVILLIYPSLSKWAPRTHLKATHASPQHVPPGPTPPHVSVSRGRPDFCRRSVSFPLSAPRGVASGAPRSFSTHHHRSPSPRQVRSSEIIGKNPEILSQLSLFFFPFFSARVFSSISPIIIACGGRLAAVPFPEILRRAPPFLSVCLQGREFSD